VQYEVRFTAELRRSNGAVVAKETAEPFAVTLSPDCSTDTLIFTHNDIQDFKYRLSSKQEKRTPTFSQTVPQCPVACSLYEFVNMGSHRVPRPYNTDVVSLDEATG
jgi:hypothetical protein